MDRSDRPTVAVRGRYRHHAPCHVSGLLLELWSRQAVDVLAIEGFKLISLLTALAGDEH